MRIGIDFGTTHTVAAVVDRGNYPVASFDGADTWPSVVAANAAGELRFGLDAAGVRHDPRWSVLRSFKRLLNDAGPGTEVSLGGHSYPLADLLTSFLIQLKSDLHHRSNAGLAPGERIEAAISVPANASSTQRFLTLDAFTKAGFEVVALLNEPSAAGFEYAHRYRSTITAKREYVLIYDLGGGTFDASLLKMTGRFNEVVTSEGIRRLGGDDFDEAIYKLVVKGSTLGTIDVSPRAICWRSAPFARKPSARTRVVSLWTSRWATARGSAAGSTTSMRRVRRSSRRRPGSSLGCCVTRLGRAARWTGPKWRVSTWWAGLAASRWLPGCCARRPATNTSSAHRTRLRPRPSAWRSSWTRRPSPSRGSEIAADERKDAAPSNDPQWNPKFHLQNP